MLRTARTFKISAIIVILLMLYVFREEVMLGGLRIYALTKSPHAYRILGEFYSDRSYQESKKAALYFQKALAGYKDLVKMAPEDERKFIEFIIGTHYECGRGTNVDLKEAKDWYEKSIESGNKNGYEMLDRVKKALSSIDQKK